MNSHAWGLERHYRNGWIFPYFILFIVRWFEMIKNRHLGILNINFEELCYVYEHLPQAILATSVPSWLETNFQTYTGVTEQKVMCHWSDCDLLSLTYNWCRFHGRLENVDKLTVGQPDFLEFVIEFSMWEVEGHIFLLNPLCLQVGSF